MTDEPTRPPIGPGGRSFRRWAGRAVIGAAVIAWMLGVLWLLRPTERTDADGGSRRTAVSSAAGYVGNRACAECHPGEYAKFLGSGHARTLGPANDSHALQRVLGLSAVDPENPRATWSFTLNDGRLELDRTEDGHVERERVDYAFGSGHHAMTFLTLTGGSARAPEGLEHRISFFAQDGSLGLSPGQRRETRSSGITPLGRHFSAAETQKCFECHCTVTSDRENDALDVRTMIANVTCERCHGPARTHVEAARRGKTDMTMRFGSGRWTAGEQMKLCGQCHRLPEFVPPEQRVPENAALRRFQSVGLMLSQCYTASRGALSCVTCHDPHARVSSNAATYNAACVRCHEGAPQATCRIDDADCIKCHMPREPAGSGLWFADHWIRRRR